MTIDTAKLRIPCYLLEMRIHTPPRSFVDVLLVCLYVCTHLSLILTYCGPTGDGSSSTPNPPSDTMSSPARRIAAAERIGVPAGLSIDTKGSAAQSKLTVTDWGTSGSGLPSVTLKLAMDRNGAIDDLSSGPKRFTCQASLDAGKRAGSVTHTPKYIRNYELF